MKKGLIGLVVLVTSFHISGQSTDGLSLVFQDNFSNNKNGWLIDETGKDVSWINYNENRLVIDSDKGEGRISMNANKGFNGDFVLKASIWCKECSGIKMSGLGLMFGFDQFSLKSEQGWYGMKLMQDATGKDGIWVKANNGNGGTLFEQTANASFDPDDNNEIAIERKGDTVNFYLNGTQIYSNTTAETSGNKIAFVCGPKIKAYMSELSFWTK